MATFLLYLLQTSSLLVLLTTQSLRYHASALQPNHPFKNQAQQNPAKIVILIQQVHLLLMLKLSPTID